MNKYLTRDEIYQILGDIQLDKTFELMSQDSYNETKIAAKVIETGRVNELCMAAINMAVVGFGNQRYGNFRLNNEVIDIAILLRNTGVRTNLPAGALLREDELTPQRLCRFFRHKIRDYIDTQKVASYLFRKYSNRDPRYAKILFRGAEYLEDLKADEREYLTNVYITLDSRLGTNISERLRRVFEAKGLIPIIPI